MIVLLAVFPTVVIPAFTRFIALRSLVVGQSKTVRYAPKPHLTLKNLKTRISDAAQQITTENI